MSNAAPEVSSAELIPFVGASLLPLPSNGARTLNGVSGTNDHTTSDWGLLFYTEFRGIGPPQLARGRPGDIYVNISPDNPELYVRLRDSWVPWGGPHYRNNVTSHPLRNDLYLWCTRDTGPVWQAMTQVPHVEQHDTGNLVTAAQCIAGWLVNHLKHVPPNPKQTTLQPNNPAQRPEVEQTIPAKRKDIANADDAPRLSKRPSPERESERSYTFHADSNNILSFPVEEFIQSFPTTIIANSARPFSIDETQSGQYAVRFSHFWGPLPPSDEDGTPGDIFFVVSPKLHKIFIKFDTWVQWPGLCSPDFEWFTHPELRGMVAWIDGTQATWIKTADFISRCRELKGSGNPRRTVINPHDCVTELLPKTPLKLLPRYFIGFEPYGLLLSWKLGFEHFKTQNHKLLQEVHRLKNRLKKGRGPGRLHHPISMSEAGMQTDRSPRTQETSSVENFAQHTSVATQTSPAENAEPPLANTLSLSLLSPMPAPSTQNALDGHLNSGPNIGQTSGLSEREESLNDGGLPTNSALPLEDGYVEPRPLAIQTESQGNTAESPTPPDLSLSNNLATDAIPDFHPRVEETSVRDTEEFSITSHSVQPPASLESRPQDFRSNLERRSEALSGCMTPVREVDEVQPTVNPLQLSTTSVSSIERDMASRNPLDTATGESSKHSSPATGPELGSSSIIAPDISITPSSQLTDGALPAVDDGAASELPEVPTEDSSLLSDEDCYLEIIFHAARNSSSRVCRLCLQLEIPQVVEYPQNTSSGRLLAHCKAKHYDTYEILAGMTPEQLLDILDKLSAASI